MAPSPYAARRSLPSRKAYQEAIAKAVEEDARCGWEHLAGDFTVPHSRKRPALQCQASVATKPASGARVRRGGQLYKAHLGSHVPDARKTSVGEDSRRAR